MAGFLIGEALRDLRRAGRVAVSAVVLITLSLGALGGFWLVSSNLDRAVAKWRDRVRIVVYLKREPSAGDVAALLERVRVMPGVAGVVFIGKADALRALKQVLGKDAGVVDQLPVNPLPASLEVTPAAGAATPEGARELLTRLAALPEADEVAGSADWVEQLSRWQRLLTTIGLGVGDVLAVAAILTVTTATTLILHSWRDSGCSLYSLRPPRPSMSILCMPSSGSFSRRRSSSRRKRSEPRRRGPVRRRSWPSSRKSSGDSPASNARSRASTRGSGRPR